MAPILHPVQIVGMKQAQPDIDPDTLLARIAAAEAQSEHPIARAIVAAAQEKSLTLPQATMVNAIPGHGLSARVDDADLLIGAARLIAGPCGTGRRS